MKKLFYIFVLFSLLFCSKKEQHERMQSDQPYILVLGNAQDAGYPQIACQKECCQRVYENPQHKRMVSSIAIVDPISSESWIFDATPDFPEQAKLLSSYLKNDQQLPQGIFLTHGHIGHYTGLMFLGREALGASNMPVYVMPKMQEYLSNNGPWSQLVLLNNIELRAAKKDSIIVLNKRISVIPIQVPHRDEFTETVGFMIINQGKKALFIPDIDKWGTWDRRISNYVKEVDIALLDASFYKDGEIDRDMNEIPHPFVEESMRLFDTLPDTDRKKIHFIHFNHTNPLLIEGSAAEKTVLLKGYKLAKQEMIIPF